MISALKKLLLLSLVAVISTSVLAQAQKISGKVISEENGNPLIGVTVSVKGKSNATQTNSLGEFSINAVQGDVLLFSFTGYAPLQYIVVGSAEVSFSMKVETSILGEVVVVGYGSQKRTTVTSSISKLDKEVLANAPRSNVGTALQGTLPGLRVVNTSGQPGASPNILLRGGASINSPGSPLVVVDGIIRPFNDIPTEDIASIELLKDAASTAIYGARANNGVILITTRQGRAGRSEISYRFTAGFNKERENYKFMNAKDYIYYGRLGNFNSGISLSAMNSTRGMGLLTDAANLASFDIRSYNSSTSYLLQAGWDTVGDPYGGTIIFKDHGGEVQDILFRNTNTQDHYINFSGGNDKGKYFASFDYYDEDGVIVGSGYKRYSGVVNGSYKVKPNVEVSSGINLSTSSQLGVNGSEVNNLYRNLALWPTFNPWIDSAKTRPNPGNGVNDGNPLYWLSRLDRRNEINRITASASVKWDIIKGLYVKATGNGYLREEFNESFQKSTQTYANIFATPPSFSNTSRTSFEDFSRDFSTQFNGIVNYEKRFADKHNLNVMLGAEYYGIKSYGQNTTGTNAPTDDISTSNASTTFAAGINGNNSSGVINGTAKSEYKIISEFGRLNYDYDQRYLLTFVARRDGVSALPEGNRFGFFPGMSAGWNLHKEKFYENMGLEKYISTFKPRVSYGVNGNVAGLGRYEVQGTYASQGLYNGGAGFLNTGLVNNNLRWEKSKTFDIGLDIGILKDRFNLIFDYYDRRTSDLLTNLILPSYVGFGSVRTNLGTFQNRGYEFAANANVLNSSNGIKLDVSANASFVTNKVLKLPYNGNDKNRQGGLQIYDPKSGQIIWVGGLQEGETLGAIYGYKQVSIFKDAADVLKIAGNRFDNIAKISGPNRTDGLGKITEGDVNWLDVDKNDTIDSRDQVYLGNINPKWVGGFTTTLSYKGFSFYAQFEFALGNTIYNDNVARILGEYQGTFNYIEMQKQAWSPTNRDATISKVYSADQRSAPQGKKNFTRANNASPNLNGNNSRFYEKGDYLACREITFSYDVTRKLLSKTKVLAGARLFISANNLFHIKKFSGPTPEPPVSNNVITGVYQGTYPTPRTFVTGVQVTF
ncbi:MAG: SusC/RagA family TonB-linked outer membrane protein [Sphingobacteriales bacterium UTBCD1]|jgi:TonB-linked SusC/RagA family outer membrane protein|nr:MAG: SusC/RagA family TonB-linked outer membrane protein [Sphingobacteriales bacterium UTBCD1]